MHGPKGLNNARSASPRAAAWVGTAVSHEGILSEASSPSSHKAKRRKIFRTWCEIIEDTKMVARTDHKTVEMKI